jgi:hypothetical protein
MLSGSVSTSNIFMRRLFWPILLSQLAILASFPAELLAGPCEDQLSVGWRRSLNDKKLPIGKPIEIKSDGTLGNGTPNSVIDRPFHNVFQGSQWLLITTDYIEFFTPRSIQGMYRDCEGVPFSAISIGERSAPLIRVFDGPIYQNKFLLTPEAKSLISQSSADKMYIITSIGTRFPVGLDSTTAIRELFSIYKSNKPQGNL